MRVNIHSGLSRSTTDFQGAAVQPLSLRVLRLQRPTLPSSSCDQPEVSTLLLPTSFGQIHLGESFAALLVATNSSDAPVDSAGLRSYQSDSLCTNPAYLL